MLKKSLATIMSLVLAVGLMPLPAFAEAGSALQASSVGVQSESASFTFDADTEHKTATITGYSGTASGNLTIPGAVVKTDSGGNGITCTVTAIGEGAFKDKSGFTGALTLPDSVTAIGAHAFDGCSGLTGSITLPTSLKTIGDYAFAYLEGIGGTISIPASVSTIGAYAFAATGSAYHGSVHDTDWTGFTGVSFASGGNLTTIGNYAFARNYNIRGGIAIPEGVVTIGDGAFYDTCSLLAKPNGEGYTPEEENVQGTLTLPSTIQYIGKEAFYYCGFSGDLVIPNATCTIGSGAFNNAGFLGTLTLPEGTTTIPDYAFCNCDFTGELTLPSTLTSIGEAAFSGCGYFDSTLSIPSGVTTISDYAFDGFGSDGATGTLTLPNTLTSIGSSAFADCENFTCPLILPDSVSTIGRSAFWRSSGFTSLKLPNNSGFTVIEERTFGNWLSDSMGFEGELAIPSSVTVIGDAAFYGCDKLTGGLDLSNVTSLGKEAFEGCESLDGELKLNNQANALTSIPYYAFFNCKNLTGSITLPSGLTIIGDYAFYKCEKLTGELSIPSTVTTIERDAFEDCAGLTGSLAIPSSVTKLGGDAFKNCSGFTGTLDLSALSMTSVPGCFAGCTGITEVKLPAGATTIEYGAFRGFANLTSIALPNTITSIASDVFSGCTGLTGDLTLPASLKSIGSGVFQNCSRLDGTLTIPSTVTASMNWSAFEGTNFQKVVKENTTEEASSNFTGNNVDGFADESGTEVETLTTGTYTRIKKKDIATAEITLSQTEFVYDGDSKEPIITKVVVNGIELVEGTDWEFLYYRNWNAYPNHTSVGSPYYAYIKGIGAYGGTARASYAIVAASTSPDEHSHTLVKTDAVAATCAKAGTAAYWTCSGCGKKFSDAAGASEISAPVTIAALGHTWDSGKVTKAATYDAAGVRTYTCTRCGQTRTEAIAKLTRTSIASATVSGVVAKTYIGKALTQNPTVKVGSSALKPGTDYTLSYKNNVKAGTATLTVTGKGAYTGTKSVTFKINKAANPLSVKAKTAAVSYAKLKKREQVLAVSKVIATSKKGQGAVTYAKKSGNVKIAVDKKTGKVTVKKGLKKGSYKVKVAVKAAGNANYKSATKTVTFAIKVK